MRVAVVCEINCQWITGDKVDTHQRIGKICFTMK